MSSLPWEPDRRLTAQDAQAVITANFPHVDAREVEFVGSGWEFDVYRTRDDWAFRFPRRAEYERLFDAERGVIQLVGSILAPAVAVPDVQLVGEPGNGFPYRFGGHRFISGVSAGAVSPELEAVLARSIGRTLNTVHSIAEERARKAGLSAMDLEEPGRAAWLRRGQELMRQLRGMDPAIDSALEWATQLAWPLPGYDGPLHLIHHDLAPEHLIVNPASGELVGIIDWTDAILGDPARDFVALVVCRGWSFAEQVLGHYDVLLDVAFRDRLTFMARLLSTMWLTEAHVQGGDEAKHIGWIRNAFVSGSAS